MAGISTGHLLLPLKPSCHTQVDYSVRGDRCPAKLLSFAPLLQLLRSFHPVILLQPKLFDRDIAHLEFLDLARDLGCNVLYSWSQNM
jgi:hypothetical protein